MKRSEQLRKLSKEHHGSLVMAKKVARIAEEGNDAELLEAIEAVQQYYNNELELHFQHEEQTIFSIIFQQHEGYRGMATTLLKEHGYIRMLVQRLTPETARKELADFALVLKDHTRLEERELFPAVQELFTDDQLDAVLNYAPID